MTNGKTSDPQRWVEIESALTALLNIAGSQLPSETVEAVRHYLRHAEYELALEGLILDIMTVYPAGINVDWAEYLKIARELSLHEESTFDPQFWDKFTTYTHVS